MHIHKSSHDLNECDTLEEYFSKIHSVTRIESKLTEYDDETH